jgi:hypothetical protein
MPGRQGLLQRPVPAMQVVMIGVLTKDQPQVPLAPQLALARASPPGRRRALPRVAPADHARNRAIWVMAFHA